MSYSIPNGNAIIAIFVDPYSAPDGDEVDANFVDVGADQYLLPAGIEAFAAGWVLQVEWTQTVSPSGFLASTIGGVEKLNEFFRLNAVFEDPYTAPTGNAILVDLAISDGELLPTGWLDSAFGSHTIYNSRQYVTPSGLLATSYGTATVVTDPEIKPIGFDASSIGSHEIVLGRRIIAPASLFSEAFGTHRVDNFDRSIDLAGNWILGQAFGTQFIAFGERFIEVPFIVGTSWGTATVGTDRVLLPAGIEPGEIGSGLEVLDNSQRISVLNGIVAPTFNAQEISNFTRSIAPAGMVLREIQPSEQWGRPDLINSRQIVYVLPDFTPQDGGVFGQYNGIENRNRPITHYGHLDSKVSKSAVVENAARALELTGFDASSFGVHLVAPYIRTYTLEGIEPCWFTPYHAVHNAAFQILPLGINQSAVGTPLWSNPPQDVRFTGHIDSAEYGTPFVSRRIRTVTTPLGVEATYGMPQVELKLRYVLAPSVATGGFGAHYVEEHFTVFAPSSILQPGPLPIDHRVHNNTPEIHPYAHDMSAFGTADIRYDPFPVAPSGVAVWTFGQHVIRDRRQTITFPGLQVGAMGMHAQVRNDSPDPPSTRTLQVGAYMDLMQFPSPIVRRNEIAPEGLFASVFGEPVVRLIGAYPSGWISLEMGTPIVSGAQYISLHELGIDAPSPDLQRPDLQHRTIWCQEDAPEQAVRNHGGIRFEQMDTITHTTDHPERPVFGSPAISNSLRSVHQTDSAGPLLLGEPSVDNQHRTIFPVGLRSLRMGIPKVPNERTIRIRAGVPPPAFGERPAVDNENRAILPQGFDYSGPGDATVDFFHRYRYPSGWDSLQMGEPSESDSPNSVGLRVHPPEPLIPGMGVQTLWGETMVSHFNRDVYPVGFDALLMGHTPGQFNLRMRVTRRTGLYPPSIAPGAIGTATIWQSSRTVLADRIQGQGIVPSPSVRFQSIIALGGFGWDSSVFGDVQYWEPGTIKPQGEEHTLWGTARIDRRITCTGIASATFGAPSVGPSADAQGFEATLWGMSTVTHEDNFHVCGQAARALPFAGLADGAFGTTGVAHV